MYILITTAPVEFSDESQMQKECKKEEEEENGLESYNDT